MAWLYLIFFVSCIVFNSSFGSKSLEKRSDSISMDVQEFEIISNITFRYANVLVRSLMYNPREDDQESTFTVRLPKEAYITSFEIETENRTIKAVIKEKRAAQEEYDQAKQDNVIAGLVSQQNVKDDLDIDIFQIKINVAAYSKIEFRLRYEEFLQRRIGEYTQMLFIDTDQVIPSLEVTCNLKEKESFKEISYKTPFSSKQDVLEKVEETDDGFEVNAIVWKPSQTDQVYSPSGLEAPFELTYSLEVEYPSGILLTNDAGEFIHFFSVLCNEDKILAKQIVFVIDISGSMNGNAIQQVRVAMKSILMQLRSKDYFNIVLFDGTITMWRTSFQKANSENVDIAKSYVDQYVRADGSTNINDALLEAVRLFEISKMAEQTGQIIMFLTDGSPTAGVTNTDNILKNVRDANYASKESSYRSAIYPIAFGRNADLSFLRSIAYQNAGSLTIIKDIQSYSADKELIDMYKTVENPFFKDLNFSFAAGNEDIPERDITQTFFVQYDCGGEIVISGRGPVGEIVKPHVQAHNVVFPSVEIISLQNEDSARLSRLIGYQWVRQLLMESESAIEKEERDKARKLALDMSLKYGFVTPLTSLVVTDYPTYSDSNRGFDVPSSSKSPSITFSSPFVLFGNLLFLCLLNVI